MTAFSTRYISSVSPTPKNIPYHLLYARDTDLDLSLSITAAYAIVRIARERIGQPHLSRMMCMSGQPIPYPLRQQTIIHNVFYQNTMRNTPESRMKP